MKPHFAIAVSIFQNNDYNDYNNYHNTRYFHTTPQALIQECGERRLLAIGVVKENEENYYTHAQPGWLEGTVGYNCDDGKIFDSDFRLSGKEVKGMLTFNLSFAYIRYAIIGRIAIASSMKNRDGVLISTLAARRGYQYSTASFLFWQILGISLSKTIDFDARRRNGQPK